MPEVVYTMSLKDRLTSGLHTANEAAETLHGTMTSLLTTLGIGFGLYKLVDYFKEAREEVEKIHQAENQLQAGLASTHHAAGVNFEELEEKADKLSHAFKYTKSEILDMQSLMLTFPGITEKTFDGASQAILDMSARLHKGADETAIMVGKALQDPARGITALRRVGVNFDKEHTERIKRMVEQGHILQAQAAIITELQTEFAGSAAANAAADPMFFVNKSFYDTKIAIGEVVEDLQKQLAPALLYIAERFRDLVDWLKKNGDQVWNLVKALGAAFLAYKTGTLLVAGYTLAIQLFVPAEVAATEATEGFAAASTLALGPIGLIAAAIAGLVFLYNEATDSVASLQRQTEEFNKKAYTDEQSDITAGIESIQKKNPKLSYKQAFDIMTSTDRENILATMRDNDAKMSEANAKIKEIAGSDLSYKEKDSKASKYVDQLQNATTQAAILKNQLAGVDDVISKGPVDISKKGALPAGEGIDKTKETKGAKGNKVVTFNIHIGSLIKQFSVSTINMKEGAKKAGDMVAQSLMNAVNNSQITTGN